MHTISYASDILFPICCVNSLLYIWQDHHEELMHVPAPLPLHYALAFLALHTSELSTGPSRSVSRRLPDAIGPALIKLGEKGGWGRRL